MNDFMEVFNEYGWTVYYFSGFITGCFISIFVGFILYIGDAILEYFKDLKNKKENKDVKKL